jgi:DNA-binding NarL/FixJ family response regulator
MFRQVERHILIIEDDPNWQQIFGEIVDDAGFTPRVAASRQAAQTALADQAYALAIVDISLVESDHANRGGVDMLKEITGLPTDLPAIVVTGYATVDLAIETLVHLNAVHFFRKEQFDRREFKRVVSSSALPKKEPNLLQVLSAREKQVLELLIEGRTNNQIAAELTITVNTVKKHVQSIFTKFNVDSRAAAVARALGRTGGP